MTEVLSWFKCHPVRPIEMPSTGRWIGDPVGLGIEVVAEALEMLVEVGKWSSWV